MKQCRTQPCINQFKLKEQIGLAWFWLKTGQLKRVGVAKEICPCCHKDENVIHILHKCRENLLSSSLLSKNLKIKIYKTIILSVVLYGCETWLLTL